MTAIVGLVEDDVVYIGGDSAGVSGLSITVRADEKVFINNSCLMGFTTSFRMGQLLRYKLKVPEQKPKQDDMEYMVVDFIDAIKKCFNDNGFGSNKEGGTFLVGYKGNLYTIDSDYQVGKSTLNLNAVGCGAEIALGSLYSTKGKKPKDRIKMALEAASAFNAGVCAPFITMKLAKSKIKSK